MNKERMIFALVIICICIGAIYVGILSIQKAEERSDGCKSICLDKGMEYYNYNVGGGEGNVFCQCLDEGVEKRFVFLDNFPEIYFDPSLDTITLRGNVTLEVVKDKGYINDAEVSGEER